MAVNASTRRAAPLASVPAVAATISPSWRGSSRSHDAQPRRDGRSRGERVAFTEDCRKAGRCARVSFAFPLPGWEDTMAKAACLARLYPLADAEADLVAELRDDHAYLDAMALGIACEVMRHGSSALRLILWLLAMREVRMARFEMADPTCS